MSVVLSATRSGHKERADCRGLDLDMDAGNIELSAARAELASARIEIAELRALAFDLVRNLRDKAISSEHFRRMEQDVDDLRGIMREILEGQPRTDRLIKNVRSKAERLCEDVAELRDDVSGLHYKIGDVHDEITDMRAEITDMRAETTDMRAETPCKRQRDPPAQTADGPSPKRASKETAYNCSRYV